MRILVRIILIVIMLIVLLIISIYLYDHVTRYFNWNSLTKEKIISETGRFGKYSSVCLYTVECSKGYAKLKMIKNFNDIDIDKLRETIWRRKFYFHCPGRIENIILDFTDEAYNTNSLRSSYRWSFRKDNFLTNNGHFQGSFVSDEHWERCTECNAIVLEENSTFDKSTCSEVYQPEYKVWTDRK